MTVALSVDCPVVYFPVMGARMWQKPAVQRNIARIREDGQLVNEPEWHDGFDPATGTAVRHPSLPAPDAVAKLVGDLLAERAATAVGPWHGGSRPVDPAGSRFRASAAGAHGTDAAPRGPGRRVRWSCAWRSAACAGPEPDGLPRPLLLRPAVCRVRGPPGAACARRTAVRRRWPWPRSR